MKQLIGSFKIRLRVDFSLIKTGSVQRMKSDVSFNQILIGPLIIMLQIDRMRHHVFELAEQGSGGRFADLFNPAKYGEPLVMQFPIPNCNR